MQRRISLFISLLLALTGVTFVSLATVSAGTAQAKDVDCSDFSSQAAAQHYFIDHGGPNSDPDGLDADGDGVACESNPCPCDHATGGGGGGGHPVGHKPPHKIQAHGHEIRHTNRFEILGKVSTFKNGRFQLQRKVGYHAYRLWKYVHTTPSTGSFRTRIFEVGNKKTCFRVVVPETKHYRKTVSPTIGCISTN